jgi:hypothetical protein
MITRRGMVNGMALVAGALGAGYAARARAGTPVAVRLADLPGVGPSPQPVWVEGQGWFVSVPATGSPDGVVRIAGSDGTEWLRSDYRGTVHPQWFVSEDDAGDDARAIQRACDFAAAERTAQVDLGNAVYRCRSRLEVDPTRTAIVGAGALLDFAEFKGAAANEDVLRLDSSVLNGGWQRDGTALVHVNGAETEMKHFLALAEEGRYRVDLAYSRLEGTNNLPFCRLRLTTPDGELIGRHTSVAAGRYAFEVTGPHPVVRLTLESDADVRLESLTITRHGRRECILVRSSEDSGRSGHKWLEGVTIAGPGEGTLLHGIRFETEHETRSSRIDMRNVVIEGFDTGMVFSHRSYLCRFYGVRCVSRVAVQFLGSSEDAGEGNAFFGCILGGGEIGIVNNGAEVMLNSTSVNFCKQVFVGSGTLTMQSCHIETHRPTEPAQPLFDIAGGHVSVSGGVFLVSGQGFEEGNQCDHIFELRSRAATATMAEVTCYNLRSRTGALGGGPGRLETVRLRGWRPRHIAPIVQFDRARNLLGAAPFDFRRSDAIEGSLSALPMEGETLLIAAEVSHLWLCGRAQPGVEIGVSLEARCAIEADIDLQVFALDGEKRLALDRPWLTRFGPDWRLYQNSTFDAHPAASTDGRMPEGFGQLALLLDLSRAEAPVELRGPFMSAG